MQETRVLSLVQDDPTCHGAPKPCATTYWACVLEPESLKYQAHVPQLLKLNALEPVLRYKRSHCSETTHHS